MALDNSKIKTEDWILKPSLSSTALYCYDTKTHYTDFHYVDRIVTVVGTELQLFKMFEKLLKEEALQLRGSVEKKTTEEYLEIYKNNNYEPVIIR
tara:strand:+ start:1008 stop:1292 length:285 start_codon:yes stop_codon:yes gene_type:complete